MISDAYAVVADVRDDEQQSYENLPEGIQESDTGAAMEQNVDTLCEAMDFLSAAIQEIERVG